MTVIFCACNTWRAPQSEGGVVVGGDSWDLSVDTLEWQGGAVVGGNEWDISIPTDPTDGFLGLWAMNESASPYLDRTRYARHGTAIDAPTQSEGVFCQPAQLFSGIESITIPAIPLPQKFTVSLWVRLDSEFSQRQLFKCGAFTLQYTILRHLWASLTTEDEEGNQTTYDCFSVNMLEKDRWYLVAATFDGSKLSVYINGQQEQYSVEVSGTPVVLETTGIGLDGSPEGTLQDLRFWGGTKSEDYLIGVHDNYCKYGFLEVGEEEESAVSVVRA